ncbi:hypothetical protein SERLA73DRAFT_105231 [Serpula lacrymans var. lacrymans S7.3]|uniref:Leucine carboxyl methyltransferase 1 n=2 Tax=Serpula lacrymans var. lacrymans TaxID=341189 RepID=F8PSW5_SERL3|nr:uncharacterized protein SERLADRAFT_414442 [Serpula lacrymans var. lacrymans S7.9]EGO00823.1 hypothetical protein SERLA73DRAFT_105231 [Serpula lacrymans var. lacrymans S7.3]EGO26380.1 hypothetical protein SERLADRAFT_414442 [Serpula lacrymans var. lacrymans S7.9]
MYPPPHPNISYRNQDSDAAIRLTDSDAALARLSAVKKGYMQDPFIKHLIPRAHLQPPRPPLINIGTYVRSEAIDNLIDEWLEISCQDGKKCQLVSLGAGSDSRFWRLATGPHKDKLAAYIEVDFPDVTTKKAMALRKSRELSAILGSPEQIKISHGGTALHAKNYHLLPVDLRLPPSESLATFLAKPLSDNPSNPILSHSLPTLLIFECVLVYMSPEASSALIQWFVDYFHQGSSSTVAGGHAPLAGIVYEMFGLRDAFGQVMLNNLKSRNVVLPGAEPYPTISSLPHRFLKHGFTTCHALSLREIRRHYTNHSELKRISSLEMLDEVEELNLVLEHYGITWGIKLPDASDAASNLSWGKWGLKPAEKASEEME